jgi:hypothetical protein
LILPGIRLEWINKTFLKNCSTFPTILSYVSDKDHLRCDELHWLVLKNILKKQLSGALDKTAPHIHIGPLLRNMVRYTLTSHSPKHICLPHPNPSLRLCLLCALPLPNSSMVPLQAWPFLAKLKAPPHHVSQNRIKCTVSQGEFLPACYQGLTKDEDTKVAALQARLQEVN